MYFTGGNIIILSNIKTLREEEWKKASAEERVDTLRECEKRISEFEKRPTCEVSVFSEEHPNVDGAYSRKTGKISISQEIVQDKSSSYKALSILIEESHHAFQDHALKTPGFYKGGFLEEWKWNARSGNYCEPPENHDPERAVKQEAYENQPIEKTAKDVAKSVVNELKREHEIQRADEQLKDELKQVQQKKTPDSSSNHALTGDKEKFEPKSAKVIEVKDSPGQDPKILIQFGDNESKWFTAKGLKSGANLKDLSIPADLASRLQNAKEGESLEADVSTRPSPKKNKQQEQGDLQSSQSQSHDQKPKEKDRGRDR